MLLAIIESMIDSGKIENITVNYTTKDTGEVEEDLKSLVRKAMADIEDV